jgi:hypothetical protein
VACQCDHHTRDGRSLARQSQRLRYTFAALRSAGRRRWTCLETSRQ